MEHEAAESEADDPNPPCEPYQLVLLHLGAIDVVARSTGSAHNAGMGLFEDINARNENEVRGSKRRRKCEKANLVHRQSWPHQPLPQLRHSQTQPTLLYMSSPCCLTNPTHVVADTLDPSYRRR